MLRKGVKLSEPVRTLPAEGRPLGAAAAVPEDMESLERREISETESTADGMVQHVTQEMGLGGGVRARHQVVLHVPTGETSVG